MIKMTHFCVWNTDRDIQFSSVAQSCLTLCDPMDCSTLGFPVYHHPRELAQTYVHFSVTPTNHLIICHPLLLQLQSFPASGSFLMSQFFPSGDQSIWASPSVSVLPTNIQDWFPLGWTGLISLQSEGLSRIFSNTTVQNISSGLTFKSLIHFEFIFVYGVRKCSSFILLQVVDQFSQHHLLKRLSFFRCISMPPLSKIRCP